MKKIALLGSTHHEYKEGIEDVLRRYGNVWMSWTYLHEDEQLLKLLQKQIKKYGYFAIFAYIAKKPREKWSIPGSGKVDYWLKIEDFIYGDKTSPCPDPRSAVDDGVVDEKNVKSRGWYLVREIPHNLDPPKKWSSFLDYNTKEAVQSNQVQHLKNMKWVYIRDEDSRD